MYIEPNTTVKLFHGVPLDLSYRNTVVWDSVGAQTSGFDGYLKHTLSRQTYQRVNQGLFRCGLSANSCYDCNYMAFQNTAYGDKWFYAFITKVEYVNDNMCNITFLIDIIQSYYFQWDFEHCFVERETVASDRMFEHTINENFTGDTISYKTTRNIINTTLYGSSLVSFVHIICVSEAYIGAGSITGSYLAESVLTDPSNWGTFIPQTVGNVFNSMGYYVFDNTADAMRQASHLIQNYTKADKKDAIQMIYSIPRYCLNGVSWSSGNYISTSFNNPTGATINISDFMPTSFQAEGDPSTFGGYTPKNKKLFTYPFCFLELSNKNGTSQILRFEDISPIGDSFTGYLTASFGYMPNSTVLCRPSVYGGKILDDNMGVALEGIQIGNYTSDTFMQWWSGARASYIAKNAQTALHALPKFSYSRGATNLNKTALGTVMSLADTAVDMMAQAYQSSIMADSVMGDLTSFSQLYANRDFDLSLTSRVIRPELAKSIDEFFSMYGYKVNTIKVPNVRNRPHWTYIKTLGCNIKGSMPADDVEQLQSIVDNGITFWRNISEVGNYSLDNSV